MSDYRDQLIHANAAYSDKEPLWAWAKEMEYASDRMRANLASFMTESDIGKRIAYLEMAADAALTIENGRCYINQELKRIGKMMGPPICDGPDLWRYDKA
jgi:hypothetical protein